MTITVTSIDQGPFTATGLAQTVAYTFMTLTDDEISVFYDIGAGRVAVDPSFYAVSRDKNVDGSAKEGGSVQISAAAISSGASIYLRANPRDDRDLVWSDTGSRLKNLNEEQDRITLRQLIASEQMARAILVEPGAAVPSPQSIIESAELLSQYIPLIGLTVSPEAFGCVSGVLGAGQAIANTVALRAAVNSGLQVDGGGRTFDIYGEFRPTLACRLRNIRLRQRSTDSSIEKHFLMDGLPSDRISLENVTIDCNGLTQVGGMSQARALQISSYAGLVILDNLEIVNGKNITAVELVGLQSPVVRGLRVRDFYPSFATEPTDDVCQGLSLTSCTNALVTGHDIRDMKATWTGAPTNRRGYSRGIVVGTSTGGLITQGRLQNVEQGIDLTGGAYGYTVSNNLIVDAGTWGIKNANRFNDNTIENNTIIRPGNAGIVLSAPGDATGVQPSRITVRNNTIKDPGASGLWPASSDSLGPRGPAGIKVGGRTVASPGYPAGVRMFGNTIEDSQAIKTMVWGIDVTMASAGDDQAFPALTNVPMVEEWDNTITGWSTGGRQRGCQYHRCGLTGTGTLSFANNTWVAIPFTLSPDRDDTAAMHDPAVNPSFITVRESGLYAIRAFLPWDNVAVGVRGLRFRVAGGNSFSQVRVPTGYGSTGSAELEIFGLVRIQAGQRVELEGFQDSGNAVVQSLAGCTIDVALVQRGL